MTVDECAQTATYDHNPIRQIFSQLSSRPEERPGYSSKLELKYWRDQRYYEGVNIFRKRLGISIFHPVKDISLDKLADLLIELGLAHSHNEGISLAHYIGDEKHLCYNEGPYYLKTEIVKKETGDGVRIKRHTNCN